MQARSNRQVKLE